MGNCESLQEGKYEKKLQKILKSNTTETTSQNKSEKYTTSTSTHSSSSNSSSINQNPSHKRSSTLYFQSFILPEKYAKRLDISKYYKILNEIGEGATSKVYIGQNKKGEKFAIKRIIKTGRFISKEAIIKEVEKIYRLNHPNIIKFYEIYEDTNFINCVMELGDTDLFEVIVNNSFGNIDEDTIIDFLIQIFKVVDYLHNVQGIIHCDLKPENFVIKMDNNKKPILKLIDFGSALTKPNGNERLHNFKGTKEYTAPETMENYGFNEKIDEWAIGIIMYNMLTCSDPFESDSCSMLRDNIKFKEINFDVIKNNDLRELNKKLLERYVAKRISVKDALKEIINIKNKQKK